MGDLTARGPSWPDEGEFRALWHEFAPLFRDRLAAVDVALAALAAGSLDEPLHTAASVAAHGLAGALGTFGLDEGSVQAREIEQALAGDPARHPEALARLESLASMLRRAIARGPDPVSPPR